MADASTYFTSLRDKVVDLLTSGTSVDLLGQAGSGRTRLMSSVTSGLVEAGWEVVRLRGVAALRDRPLEALALADLVRLPDQRNPVSSVTAAVNRVRRALADGRTALVVDDTDDLDATSVGVISAAHAQARFPVLTTSRPQPASKQHTVTLSAEIRPGVVVRVPPLTFVEAHEMLAGLLPGTIDASTVTRIIAVSGGLPSLIEAVADGARRAGRVRLVDGTWVASADLWSPGLARVVEPLVADLDTAALDALQMLSLAGTVSVATAAALVGWPALEDIDACGLLRFAPRGNEVVLAVYPPLVEERYRHLPLGVRRLHFDAQMTRLLDPVSQQGSETTTLPRAVTAPWFSPSARTDVGTSFDDGERRGIDEAELSDTVRARLMREEWHRQYLLRRREWEHEPSAHTAVPYLRALLVGNAEPATMIDVVERTPPSADLAEMAELHRWHARMLAHAAGDLDGARALLRRSAAEVGPWANLLHAVEDDLTLRLDRVPDPRPEGEADPGDPLWAIVIASGALSSGRVEDALAALATPEWTDLDMSTSRDVLIGLAHLLAGDLELALAWSSERLEEARSVMDPESIPGHGYVAVSALLLMGRLHDVRALLGSVLSIGLTPSVQRQFSTALVELAAALADREGLRSTAQALYEQARRASAGPTAVATPTWAWETAHPDPTTFGNQQDADRLWEGVLDRLDRGFVVAAVMLGGSAVATVPDPARVEVLRAAAGTNPPGLVDVVLQVAQASVDPDPDVGLQLGNRLIDAGQVTFGVRAVTQAVQALRAAGQTAEVVSLIDVTRRRLRRRGVDPEPVLAGLTPTSQLTPREHEVGTLVAGGLSNGEIARRLSITPKTVENHVNRLMRKLGATDRAAVTRAFRG